MGACRPFPPHRWSARGGPPFLLRNQPIWATGDPPHLMPVVQGLPWHPVATGVVGQAIPCVVAAPHAHVLPSSTSGSLFPLSWLPPLPCSPPPPCLLHSPPSLVVWLPHSVWLCCSSPCPLALLGAPCAQSTCYGPPESCVKGEDDGGVQGVVPQACPQPWCHAEQGTPQGGGLGVSLDAYDALLGPICGSSRHLAADPKEPFGRGNGAECEHEACWVHFTLLDDASTGQPSL